tara:strand:+ start:213 stop:782 length:570 start_codon:yes stop_codon:yes gene_type:complete
VDSQIDLRVTHRFRVARLEFEWIFSPQFSCGYCSRANTSVKEAEVNEMNVNEFAKHLGITPDTVRYYSRIGLLNPKKNANNGYREFSRDDLERMIFILRARQLGLTGSDIAMIFAQIKKGASPYPLIRELIDNRLHEIEEQIQEDHKLYDRMKHAMANWKDGPNQPASSGPIGSLLEEFDFIEKNRSRY